MDLQTDPWKTLNKLIEEKDKSGIKSFLDNCNSEEISRSISRLEEDKKYLLFTLIDSEEAASIIELITDSQAADVVENVPVETAKEILEELQSDHLADVLVEVNEDISEQILGKMDAGDAQETRLLMSYPSDVAGGLMISEFLSFNQDTTVKDVLGLLQEKSDEYHDYNVQYIYVTDHNGCLVGVLRTQNLLFPPKKSKLEDIMIKNPLFVRDHDTVSELKMFFDEHHLFGVPVVDSSQKLLGVVLPASIEEELKKQKDSAFLKISGIIGGEEFRTMPLYSRSGRRLSWLTANIVLNIIAASVIALYQDTLAAVIALAVFLPMVSDMSGCSGNQAVAVSMRELSLGLIKPNEIMWVVFKEARVGIVNGIVLGLLLGTVAFIWKGNLWLGLVVGGALAANTLLSVSLGGILPLILKRFKMDPALVSSPILTTVTDMCGFFFVLSFASIVLDKLVI